MAPSPAPQTAAATSRAAVRPSDRYGDRPRSRRPLVALTVLGALLVAAGLAWVSWGMLQPSAEGEVGTYRVVDDATVELVLEVTRPAGTTAVCTIEALGSGFGQVGIADVTVPPAEAQVSTVSVTLATSERANAAQVRNCHLE